MDSHTADINKNFEISVVLLRTMFSDPSVQLFRELLLVSVETIWVDHGDTRQVEACGAAWPQLSALLLVSPSPRGGDNAVQPSCIGTGWTGKTSTFLSKGRERWETVKIQIRASEKFLDDSWLYSARSQLLKSNSGTWQRHCFHSTHANFCTHL